LIRVLLFWFLLSVPAMAQDFSGLARINMGQSQVRDQGDTLVVDLALSQTVPYRVFTLDDPRRLVLDFREVDWTGVSRAALLNSDLAVDVHFGALRPGWSRLVLDLSVPLNVREAGMTVDTASGAADVRVVLAPVTPEAFAAAAGAPADPAWELQAAAQALLPPPPDDGMIVVAVDPGHGGIDPGAERDGLQEADLMLRLGREVAEALNRTGTIRAVLTRDADMFVPLEERMSIARRNGVDLLISLHADALAEDDARGASVYTISTAGADQASERMAERHESGDLLAGLDLSGQADRVATVLMDLARLESGPKGDRFADALVTAMRDGGVRLNSKPRRADRLAVLNAADFASVLLEAGFLSNDRDLSMLSDPAGRAPLVAAIVVAVQQWAAAEAVRAPLIRK
jgi:N-acetylmuramoyl-L-alanine amidase